MARASDGPVRADLLGIFAVTVTLLAYEVGLTRLIAVEHWHHLTHLVIAVALMGFGTAGVVTALAARHIGRRPGLWLIGSGVVVAAWVPASVAVSQQVPLNMAALPWQSRQIGFLLLYAVTFLPVFLAGGTFIAVYLMRFPGHAGRVYGADLLGSAVGALAALFVIDALTLEALFGIGGLLAASATAWLGYRLGFRPSLTALAWSGAVGLMAWGWFQLEVGPAAYKTLATQRLERGSETLLERDGLIQRLTVLAGPGAHAAPGLSVNSDRRAPAQWSLFFDGERETPLLKRPGLPNGFTGETLGGAPYQLVTQADDVLVSGAPALWHAWLAEEAGASRVDVTVADADAIDLLRGFRSEQGGVFPAVADLRHASTRRFLEASEDRYDVTILTVASPEAGVAAAQEDYLLTRQGLGRAFDRLKPDGVLAAFIKLQSMPRDTLRFLATVREVLAARGLDPGARIALVRDWRTAALMVSRQPLSGAQTGRIRGWAERWHFDIVALPGLQPDQANRFHQRRQAYFEPVQRLLGADAGAYRRDYVFDLSPPTDDRPFFFRFFRWDTLDHLRETTGRRWRQAVGWGYLLSLAALAAGSVLAAVLLAVPLVASRGRPGRRGFPLFRYFLLIGFGFMFLQITLLQKAVLLLDSASLAMGVVLAAMLSGAGLGSLGQHRYPATGSRLRGLGALVALAAILAPWLLDSLFGIAAGWPLAGRIAGVGILVGAVAVPMGFFLPFALARLGVDEPGAVAWAWAVNGFASVLATLAAGLLAMHAGLTAVSFIAAGCYAAAGWLAPRFSALPAD